MAGPQQEEYYVAGSVNKVILVGNLGKDPETRSVSNGNEVVNFSLATSEDWTDKRTGDRVEKTEWHKIVIWNEHLVKVAKKYLRKGSKVYLEGKVQTRKWEKDGRENYTTEIVLQGFDCKLVMLGGKDERSGGQGDYSQNQGASRSPAPFSEDLDDDVPF